MKRTRYAVAAIACIVAACDGPTNPPSAAPRDATTAVAGIRAATTTINVPGLGTVTLQDLGTLPGDAASIAAGVNDAGLVIGTSGGGLPRRTRLNLNVPELITPNTAYFGSTGVLHGFAWTSAAGMRALGNLAGMSASVAERVNRWGRIVGASFDAAGNDHLAVWATDSSVPHSLSLPSGTTRSHAFGVNDNGDIVGELTNPAYGGTHTVAVLWPHAGGYTIIGGIPGALATLAYSSARAINNAGEVVGYAAAPACGCPDTAFSAFTWTAAKGVVPITRDARAAELLRATTTVGPPVKGGGGSGGGTTVVDLGPPGMLDANGNIPGTELSGPGANTVPNKGYGYYRPATGAVTVFPLSTSAYGSDLTGRVVGTKYASSNAPTAALFASGQVYLLGTRTGDCCSEALSINNSGSVVGYSVSASAIGSPHAVRWTMPFTN